ncbi:MAG: hypothetical protein MUE60_12900, partial [Candidatus Eisenbacteria bacterium]|nr:hypothetical protein [Candidatus Eisenbacteria bacterium]
MSRPRSLLVMVTLTVALCVLFTSCLRDPASVGDGTGSLLLIVAFSADPASSPLLPAPASLSVDSLSVEVRGAGMTPLQLVVPVVNGTASGTLDGIPAGRDRVVTALAWSADPLVYLYQGADTVTIESGKVAEAHLVMGRLQPGPFAIIEIAPDTALVGEPVIADASASYDCYAPNDSLWFRFLLNDVEIRAWDAASRDTLPAPGKGSWCVGVEVRNGAGVRDSAECALHVMNSAPWAPSAPSPEIGDTVPSLIPLMRWTSGDPDGDSLVSTVWFGVDSDAVQGMRPPATSLSNSADSLQLPPLQPGTKYFWKVDVSDGEASSTGDLWSF